MTSCEKSRWRKISIHALREEGDDKTSLFERFQIISIHALREEGDDAGVCHEAQGQGFLSTPSARRATCVNQPHFIHFSISIHALREEGDFAMQMQQQECCCEFLSTPSARRATHDRRHHRDL